MTTITTPTPHDTHHLKTALIAVLATFVATGIALGAGALLPTGSDDPATIEPRTSTSGTELSPRAEAALMTKASMGRPPELSVEEEVRLMREASIRRAAELSVEEEADMMRKASTGSAG